VAVDYGSSAKIGFPSNISVMAGASDFKFCKPLGFAKAHHKITPRGKWPAESSDLNFASWWGLPSPIIKSHP